jgi:branched-chain amino acid transport system ATP-binding protein
VELLEVKRVSKYFGGVTAINEVDLSLRSGEIFGLIGPNGAGKTTLFNCITGYHSTDRGSVYFEGNDITSKPPYTICRMGISRTFQLVKVFLNMTVLENVMVPSFSRVNSIGGARKEALEILGFLGLLDYEKVLAGNLTLVNKKMLDLASALALRPRLLMLDEVMSGLTPTEIQNFLGLIREIRSREITVFLVEHVMEAVMPLCDRILVLNSGIKIAEDTPDKIAQNEEVIKAYLGDKYVRSK